MKAISRPAPAAAKFLYHVPAENEVTLFEHAQKNQLPLLLTGGDTVWADRPLTDDAEVKKALREVARATLG